MKRKINYLLALIWLSMFPFSALADDEPITSYQYDMTIDLDGWIVNIGLPDDFEETHRGFAYLVGISDAEEAASRSAVKPHRISIPGQFFNLVLRLAGIDGVSLGEAWEKYRSHGYPEGYGRVDGSGNVSFRTQWGMGVMKSRMSSYESDEDEVSSARKPRKVPDFEDNQTYSFDLILIGDKAFEGVEGLTEIEIPNTVTTIWSQAFKDCVDLQKVVVPNSVVAIGWGCFEGCENLTEVTLPQGLKSIETWTFKGCSNLPEVNIPNSVSRIAWSAFDSCGIERLTLPTSIEKIDTNTFANCKKLASIVIPSNVKEVAAQAFYGSENLKTVTLNEGLEIIGYRAFQGCNFETLTIPSTVKKIRNSAFSECDRMKSLTLNEGLDSLGGHAFAYCSKLTQVRLPSSLTKMGTHAFMGCYALQTAYIPSSLKRLEKSTFEDCSSLSKVEFGNNSQLEYIGGDCFAFCDNLREFEMPDKVTVLDEADSDEGIFYETPISRLKVSAALTTFPALHGIENTLATIEFGENSHLTTIAEMAFYGFSRLRSITLPAGLKVIETMAFRECKLLEEIEFPEGLTTIGNWAFEDCNSLKKIVFPKSIEDIGYQAFSSNSLKDVYVKWVTNPYYCGLEFARLNANCCLHIPKGTRSMYESYEPWKSFKIMVEEEGMGDYVILTGKNYTRYYGEENPTFEYDITAGAITSGKPTITCSATSTSPVGTYDIVIANGTISNETVVLTNGTLTITKAPLTISAGDYSKNEGEDNPTFTPKFIGFRNGETEDVLTKKPTVTTTATVTSPAGSYPVTVKGAEAQNYTISYQDGTLTVNSDIINFADANVKAICVKNWDTNGDGELSKAEAVAVRYIYASSGFKENTSITSFDELQYFKRLSKISDFTFAGSSLTSVTIPSTQYMLTIGNAAFQNCSSLKSVVLSDKVDELYAWVFENCTSLTTISIPNSVTYIGSSAFSGCSNLKSIKLSNSLTEIGESVFQNCSSLASVEIPGSVTTIGNYAFSGCESLKSFTIPSNVKEIQSGAFYKCGLTSIAIPDGVTIINSSVFRDCSNLTNVDIPNSVTSIENYAFENCSGLTNLVVPNSVTNIGNSAFYMCSNLTSITIPNNVETIGNNAFYNCTNLKEVTSLIEEPFDINANVFQYYDKGRRLFINAILYVPAGTRAKYKAAQGWKEFKNIVVIGAGNANGDEVVDGEDVTALANYITGDRPSGFNEGAADLNGDGVVDIVDLTILIGIIAK